MWLAGLAFAALCWLALGPATLETVRYRPVGGLWAIIMIPGWMIASSSRRSASRAGLPWARRHHLAVAYVRDLCGVLALTFVIVPAIAVAGLSVTREVLGAVWRGVAVIAIFAPAIQWLSGPPAGGRWPDRMGTALVGFVFIVAFAVFLDLVVTGLPIVSSGVAQAVVLVLLVIGSQVLNWRSLRRYFAGRDLVGGTM
jgi:hypothetical protein